MGIRNLNRYLTEHCNTAITSHPLRDFAGKRVVIDTSIYLYRFVGEEALIPQLYAMISMLLANRIIPIFVFDGKAPPEKRELLRRRQIEKIEAKEKYELLATRLQEEGDKMTPREIEAIEKEMDILHRQMTRITEEHIQSAKDLMDACGVQWMVSAGESDQLCAYLVRSKKAWACMSDDMDMFVLGCSRVLRNFHLGNQTVLYYSLPSILRELKWSMKEFRQIAVISGTDYNVDKFDGLTTNLMETLKWFAEYRRMTIYGNAKETDFYDWLSKHTKYIKNYAVLKQTFLLFEENDSEEFTKQYSTIRVLLKKANIDKIRDMMKKSGVSLM